MTNETAELPVPAAFVAVIVVLYVPAVVGVPEISPLVVLMLKPGGKPLAPNEVGVFVATI